MKLVMPPKKGGEKGREKGGKGREIGREEGGKGREIGREEGTEVGDEEEKKGKKTVRLRASIANVHKTEKIYFTEN